MQELSNNIDFFISYNKADVDFTQRLVERIERENYNGQPLRCFFAEWDIEPGENILLKIEESITKARYIGIVLSPNWELSNWTKLERVIPVYEDPAGIKGRIIPILLHDCNIPPSLRILKWVDFRTERNFEREAMKIISRLLGTSKRLNKISHDPPSTDLDETYPSIQNELLSSNLFQVTSIPKYIHRANSRFSNRNDVWKLLGDNVTVPAFSIKKNPPELFSFSPLNNPQQKLSQLTSKVGERLEVTKMLDSEDSRLIIEILNRSMTEHMKKMGMVYDWKNKKTFFPLKDSDNKIVHDSWKIGGHTFHRFIIKLSDSEKYYIHRSCKATFTKIGDQIFLKIVPGWHFTVDGLFTPVSRKLMTSLSTKWMNIQRNHSVLDEVRYWIQKLSHSEDTIKLDVGANNFVEISSYPLFTSINVGVELDYRERAWSEDAPEDEEFVEEFSSDELEKLMESEEEDDLIE